MQFATPLGSEKINLGQSFYWKTHLKKERKSNFKCNTIQDNLAQCIVKGIGLEKFGSQLVYDRIRKKTPIFGLFHGIF